ncbi:MAG: AMP-binding protein [Methylobacteriaceae bacterium]|nr:AMP-binding protein [Methylobacteriaceae bacterium]
MSGRDDRFWPRDVPRHITNLPATMNEALRRAAARAPERVALAFYGATITYRDLMAWIERLAAFLHHEAGLKRGDRVLILMQNSPNFVIAYQAILRAGGVVAPVNPMSLTDDVAWLIADSGARILFVGGELFERVRPLVGGDLAVIVAGYRDETPDPPPFRLPREALDSVVPDVLPKGCVAWREALACDAPAPPDMVGPDDLCVMPYTSGTTGRPKGCMHPHSNVVFTAMAQAEWYRYGADAVLTAFMPLFHVAGMQFSMNGGLAAGATLVLMTRWDRDLVSPLFLAHGVTGWSAAPPMVIDVLAAPNFDARAFAPLRFITGGGSSMPAAVAEELQRRYGLPYVEGYGMSETIAPTHINPPDRPKRQCLGIPIHETQARIVDPRTLAELAQGEVGEIVVAGPQIMRGYWRQAEADAEAIFTRGGRRWLRTGDLGFVDEDGYYFIVDRLKRMINVGGYKVSPADCEATLHRHPAVQECCVVAAPDAQRGEMVKAFVVPRAGASVEAEALIAWARSVMAAYKVPRRIEFVASLPRSGSNKIDWRSLQDREWAKERT